MWLLRFLRFGGFMLLLLPCALPLVVSTGPFLDDTRLQLRAMSYSSVEGTITLSAVRDDPRTNKHEFVVQYTYEVDGRRYEGNRYRYSPWRSADSEEIGALVSEFPVGSTVEVFYRSGAPADALLDPGPRGVDLMELLFRTFCTLGLGGGIFLAAREWMTAGAPVPSFERNGRTHVTLSGISPVITGFLWAAMTAFLLLLILAIAIPGLHVSLHVAVGAWILSVVVGVLAWRRQRVRWNAGHYDLILDEQARFLLLPVKPGGSVRLKVPWSKVTSLTIETKISKSRERLDEKFEGGRKKRMGSVSFQPTLGFTDASGKHCTETLASWSDPEQAEKFVNWLKARLGTP
jgi:hypothetical protein